MAQIEFPDEVAAKLQEAAAALTGNTGAPGTPIAMPDPMRVAPEDEAKARASSAALAGEEPQGAVPTMEDLTGPTDPFEQALNATDIQIADKLAAGSKKANDEQGAPGQVADAVNRTGLGVLQAGEETVRFFGDMIGNPDIGLGGVSDALARDRAELDRRSGINAFLGGTAQFVTGLLGVGKLTNATRLGRAVTGGKLVSGGVVGVVQGAAAAAVVMDPHAGRLSDLVEQYPALNNPITEFLANDPNDSVAMGRFKNALEGAGMDVAVAGLLGLAVKAFSVGKAVEAGTLPKTALDEAEAELATAVAQAKDPSTAGPNMVYVDPEAPVTVGGSPATVAKLPEAPNLLNKEVADTIPTEQDIIDRANGLGLERDRPAEATAKGITTELDQKLPQTGNVLTQEASSTGKVLNQPVDAAPQTGLGRAVVDNAKSAGIPLKRQPGAVDVEKALSNKPKIETNGIGYAIVTAKELTDIGLAHGVDSSNWLAAANRQTGEIYVSERVLAMPPARQAEIIAHETGHVLEKQFVKAVTGVEGNFRSLEADIKAELKAASRRLRPEHWDVFDKANKSARRGSKVGAKEAKKHGDYLHSDTELFADNFALWKTRREEFRAVAPKMAELFDEHFAPWINHDFTAHLGDVDAATKAVPKPKEAGSALEYMERQGMLGDGPEAVSDGLSAAPTGPKGVYKDKAKAERTVEQYEPEAVVSKDEAAEVARVAGNDAAAIAQHGSQEAAEAAGYRFGKANLPYQKLSTSEEVQAFIAQTAARFKAQLDEMKDGDVLSDPRVEAAVQQRVELFNEDPALVMGQLQAAGRDANAMVANMEAAFTVANKAANDLEALVKNNRLGNYAEFGGDANAAEAALAPRLALYLEALGAAQAMRSASGRALRRLRGDFQLDPKTLEDVRKLLPEDVARIVDMAGGNKKLLAKAAQEGFWQRFTRGASSMFANNLLWGWPSHVRNLIGNGFMLMSTPAMRITGSLVMGKNGISVRQQAMREYRYMLSAMDDARHMAIQAYLAGDSKLDPYGNEMFRTADGSTKMGASGVLKLKPVNTVGDAFGNLGRVMVFITGQPTRVLGMADEFFKQTSYRSSVLAEASLRADDLKLTGKDYTDYLETELGKAFDGQGRATNKAALYDAEVKTFSQPLLPGTLGKIASNAVNEMPVLRFVLPFVRTPANLFRYSLKLTPGLNLLQKEYRQMLKGELGPQRQADAYGQMALGGLLGAAAFQLGMNGMITGGGPSDPGKLSALLSTGWKPYSLKFTDPKTGKDTYVPFNNMDPVGQTMSLIADAVQVGNMGVQGELAFDKLLLPTMIAMAKNVSNRTYLRSLNDAIDAVSNPDTSMVTYAGGIASGMVPLSSMLRQVNPDPYLREARTVMDRVLSGIPGFSDDMPPQRDYAGEPILRTTGLVFTEQSAAIADAEQQRMLTDFGQGITPLSAVTKGQVDLRQFKLAATGLPAFDRYQDIISHPAGTDTSLKEALGKLIESEQYQSRSDGVNMPGTKIHALMAIVNKYREAAYGQLLRENPDLRAETAMQQQSTREALRAGEPVGVAGQIKRANAAFGVGN